MEVVDRRSWGERRVREAWSGAPGPALRGLAGLFGLGVVARHFAYDAGLVRPRKAGLPVISVGGLTVGGAGKTPLAATLAAGLLERGHRVAVATHGFPDEMGVHRTLNPGVTVVGARDRLAALTAVRGACDVAVLDDGFQRRSLHRDVDVVAVDADAVGTAEALPLPAGRHRDGWWTLVRADAVVVTRRSGRASAARWLTERLGRRLPEAVSARCRLRPGSLRPANEAAEGRDPPRPAVAVASVMKPDVFLEQLERCAGSPERAYVFPDHGGPDAETLEEILSVARDRGVVGTLKDVVDLRGALPGEVPLWYLEDRLEWEAGRERLFGLVGDALGAERDPGGAA